MRNNETGEFEVVFGNRQLLSGFFIAVLLFAVAFAMGYVVGENSRSTKARTEVAGPGVPTPVETRPQPASAAPSNPPSVTTAPPVPADSSPQPTTQPSRELENPTPTRQVAAPVRETRPTTPVVARVDPPAPVVAADAAPGSYWQVLATANRDSAQSTLETLQEKGFPVSLGPGPNNLTRVLIGPYRDTTAMGRAKTELEAAGFHPVRH